MWNIEICYGRVRSLTEAVVVLLDHEANEMEDGVSRAFVPHRVRVLHQPVAAPCHETENTEGGRKEDSSRHVPGSAVTVYLCKTIYTVCSYVLVLMSLQLIFQGYIEQGCEK